MTLPRTTTCVSLLMLLAGCATSASVAPPPAALVPEPPADIRACFVGVVDIPVRDLTVAEVERLWKQDRIRAVAMQRCGQRLLTWIDELREGLAK